MDITNDSGLKAAWCIGRVPPHALTATLVIKGSFRLIPNAPAVPFPAEEQLDFSGDRHVDDDPTRSLIYASDFAWAKTATDVFLAGSAHAQGGVATPACRIAFQVGTLQRELLVVGHRTLGRGARNRSLSGPEPFLAMPLTWEQCYGGPEFKPNPLGVGHRPPSAPTEETVTALPNVLRPDEAGLEFGGKFKPTGLGPIPMMWPQRLAKAGTYDKSWLENHWPYFPADFDWNFFNSAPVEQQLKGFLHGDEPLRFESLHPVHGSLKSALPGLRPRWFVVDAPRQTPRFREVPVHLDTVWVEPDSETLVLLWRGVLDIQSRKMTEVIDHYIVTEPLASPPLPVAHYADQLPLRKAALAEDPEDAPFELEIPEDDGAEFPDVEPGWEEAMEKEMNTATQMLQHLDAETRGHEALVSNELRHQGFKVPQPVAFKGTDDEYLLMAQAAWDRSVDLDPKLAHEMPRPTSPDFGVTIPEDDFEVPGDMEEDVDWTRELVAEAVSAGRSLAGQDLHGLDLSELDLHGADLAGAILEEARLTGSDLSGAVLTGALLAKVEALTVNLAGADLTGADLAEAQLSGARLSGATLIGADFSRATLAEGDLCRVDATDALFLGLAAERVRFTGAKLLRAEFDGASVPGGDFREADLTDASFVKTQAPGTNFLGARLKGFRAAGADLKAGRFAGVAAPVSVWEGACLEACDMTRMKLARANFESAQCRGTNFQKSDLRHARFLDADLAGADLRQVNFFRGSLQGARLQKTDFRGANMYEAELYQATVTGADFRDANLKGTKLA